MIPALLLLSACTESPAIPPPPAAMDATSIEFVSPAFTLSSSHLVVLGPTVLGSLLGAAPPPAPATDESPIDVQADEVTLDTRHHTARFEGDVRLRRGTAEISCRLLVAETGEHGELRTAHAEGDVRVRTAGVTASSPAATLDLVRGVVLLTGGVTIERADAHLASDSVDLRLDGGQIVLRRVRGTFRFPAP